MKNKALFLLFALFVCIPSFAQILDPVKWKVELSKISADGKATKIIIPSEIQGIAGLAASVKEIMKTDNK